MKKIKPCVFCGSENISIKSNGAISYFCQCDNCHWCGKTKLFKIGATKAWNKLWNNSLLTELVLWLRGQKDLIDHNSDAMGKERESTQKYENSRSIDIDKTIKKIRAILVNQMF